MTNKWQTKRLGELVDFAAGFGFPKEYQGDIAGTIPFYKVSDMNISSNTVHMYESNNKVCEVILKKIRAKVYPKGTVIFPKIGMAVFTNKKRILSTNSTFDNNVMGLIPRKINGLFLYYYLLTVDLSKLSRTTTMPSISQQDVKKITIPFPDRQIQQQIVENLDSIRKLQELNQKEIEKAEELFSTLLDSIVASKTNLQIKKIVDVAIINPPKPKFDEWDLEREVDFLPMSVLATDVPNPFPAEKKKVKEVLKGYTCFQSDDILLAKITPCFENGKTGIFKKSPDGIGFGSTEFIVIRVDKKQVLPLWVWLFIFSNKFRHGGRLRMTGSAGQKRIPVSFVENYQIPVPSLDLQQQIVGRFQMIENYRETCKKKKKLLNELFESALNKTMKGELIN